MTEALDQPKSPSRNLIEADLQLMRPGSTMVYSAQMVRAAFGNDMAAAGREVESLGGQLVVDGRVCSITKKA
jgi:hypothetical protein